MAGGMGRGGAQENKVTMAAHICAIRRLTAVEAPMVVAVGVVAASTQKLLVSGWLLHTQLLQYAEKPCCFMSYSTFCLMGCDDWWALGLWPTATSCQPAVHKYGLACTLPDNPM